MTLSDQDLRALLPRVREITLRAGAEVMRHYKAGVTARVKADGSPVTDADQAAERLIIEALAALAPDIPVVAEESVAAGHAPNVGAAPFWLVDPLDGTREFLDRNGDFTVNIALVQGSRPVLGVIHVPCLDQLFGTCAPDMAFRQVGDGPNEAIRTRKPAADGLRAVTSRSHLAAETENYLRTISVAEWARRGSSYKFCMVASGEADIYPCFNRIMEWDTAAGHAVVSAAGGSVLSPEGKAIGYGKPGFRNPPFIVRGS